jgi:hypothetical protein
MGFDNGKLVRVVVSASFGGGPDKHVNVLHYDLDDGDPITIPNDPQALADAFRDDVVPTVQLLFDSGWTIWPIVVQEEKDPLHPLAPRSEWTSGSPVAGTRTGVGDILPTAACPVASLLTANIGRRARGRMFLLGPIAEGDQNAGTIGSSQLVKWQNYLDAIPHQPDLVTGGSAATANWCVYSRANRAANQDPYAPHVANAVLHNAVHWLRSRKS